MTTFQAIVAVDANMGMAKEGDLPWHLPTDLRYFKKMTVGQGRNLVIMGRKTWDSIPARWRPLAKRQNVVLTRDRALDLGEAAWIAHDFEAALALGEGFDQVWVVGGATLYDIAFAHPRCAALLVTHVEGGFQCDVQCPPMTAFSCVERSERAEDQGIGFVFSRWERR